tara:strand:+ start:299 stop:1162 length:864 start_codon:yes stop_codon:yes gene_type:complete
MATIVTRAGKGSALTHNEVDANFTNLNTDKAELSGAAFTGNVDFALGIDVTGNVTVTGTVDGRDIATDGTKLDGVEASADVTDTANVTAAGALMDSELTALASVKAIDQGLATTDSPTFAAATVNGNIVVTGTVDGVDIAARDAVLTTTTTTATAALPKAGGTLTGGLSGTTGTFSGILMGESLQEDYDSLSGTTPAPDADNAGAFSLTTSGNTTFTFGSVTSGRSVGFLIELTAGGTHTITWPASVDWAGGSAPDAPASGEKDVLVFWTRDGGTTWHGFLAGDAMS